MCTFYTQKKMEILLDCRNVRLTETSALSILNHSANSKNTQREVENAHLGVTLEVSESEKGSVSGNKSGKPIGIRVGILGDKEELFGGGGDCEGDR